MDEFKIFNIDEEPNVKKWFYKTLYKTNFDGRTSYWKVGFDEDEEKIIMRWGKYEGKETGSSRKITENMSGKNIREQGIFEAKSRYKSKVEEDGYTTEYSSSSIIFSPMLSNNFKNVNTGKTKDIKYPVLGEPKLDGERMIAELDEDENVILKTRNNKIIEFLNHIKQELKIFFKYLPPGSKLDGEGYKHGLNFNQIQSIISRKKNINTDEMIISYHIFDIIYEENPFFIDRYNLLINALINYRKENNKNVNFKIVTGFKINNEDELYERFNYYLELGYEGMMINKLYEDSNYKFKRCDNKLKFKEFFDAEGIVIKIDEGKGSEEGAAMVYLKEENDIITRMRCMGSIDERKRWFENPEMIIGKKMNFRFQGRTVDGKPRFPVATGIIREDV